MAERDMDRRDMDRSVSQTVRAQLTLRDMILQGGLKPGERISELQAVETTGASRTPVRMALVRLEEEGLLEAIPSGGFMVKAFSERDIERCMWATSVALASSTRMPSGK